ncbi:MAG: glutathione peroxidase [Gammaproteobacteria bacterium]
MFPNNEGKSVPKVTFRVRDGHTWQEVSTDEIFNGKNVIVFSLPGAFTPTCSSSHVPRYNQLADEFKRHGIDEIVCVSVNDAFVMQEWQEDQQAWNIRFIPDGNGEFSEQMGMLVGKEDLGFGRRSWRYSMLVRDGKIEKMFIEQERPGDPYDVSDADTMLKYIAPNAPKPIDATIFTRKGCEYCVRAKQALETAGIAYEELTLNRNFSDRTLRAVAGATSFPQVFIDGVNIGGSDDLEEWLRERQAA